MNSNPKTIFLIDAFGATLSAIFLSIVLVVFEPYFGMPSAILYPLGGVAGLFAIYSFSCYLLVRNKWKTYLRIIAITNALYCITSIILVIAHYEKLTPVGLSYFVAEFIVLIFIIFIETNSLKAIH